MKRIKYFAFLLMKLLIIIVFIIVFAFIILIILDKTIFKPTPKSVLKSTFSISLKDFDYRVDTFAIQRYPNGDGHALVIYKFNELTQANIDYLMGFGLKPLPISDTELRQMMFFEIPIEYVRSNSGYYLYKVGRVKGYWEEMDEEERSSRTALDYKIFIIDFDKKIAILYYWSM